MKYLTNCMIVIVCLLVTQLAFGSEFKSNKEFIELPLNSAFLYYFSRLSSTKLKIKYDK